MSRRERREAQVQQQTNGSVGELRNILGLDPARFHPLGDQVLMDVEVEKQSSGGIIIPGVAQQGAMLVGLVREVGPKVEGVKAGERVLVNPRDPSVGRIDNLIWLVPVGKLLCKVDPKSALVA